MTQLTPEQEEKLTGKYFEIWDEGEGFNRNDLIRFARLYASAVEQAKGKEKPGMLSAERREEAEAVLMKHWVKQWIIKDQMIDAILEYAAQFQEKWISVEDELPKANVWVDIVLNTGMPNHLGFYTGKKWMPSGSGIDLNVTFWKYREDAPPQPLPQSSVKKEL